MVNYILTEEQLVALLKATAEPLSSFPKLDMDSIILLRTAEDIGMAMNQLSEIVDTEDIGIGYIMHIDDVTHECDEDFFDIARFFDMKKYDLKIGDSGKKLFIEPKTNTEHTSITYDIEIHVLVDIIQMACHDEDIKLMDYLTK